MKTVKALIKRHPLLSYFALTFAISWGVVLIAVGLGPGGFSATPQQLQMAVPYAVPAMVLGPGVTGILLTGLIYGRAGLRKFRSRLLRWRVGARWYAVAILTAPLLITAVLLSLSLLSPEFFARIFITSDKASVLLMGMAVGLGTVVGQLVAYRVLMVWVYERTESLLLAMLMHASLAGFTFILFPPSAVVANLISGFAYAAALWVVVAAVAMANGWHLTPQPLLRRVTGERGSLRRNS